MTVVGWHRPTKVHIDLNAIKKNVSSFYEILPAQTEIFAVVKADAYGHGAVPVARASLEAGATGLCVALLDEALELRMAGIEVPILVMTPISPKYLDLVQKNNLSITVSTMAWLEEADAILSALEQKPVKIHLKVETGMGRLGFQHIEELNEAIAFIQKNGILKWEGIFTHFATADSPDTDYFEIQMNRFQKVLDMLPSLPRYVHAANSAAGLWHNQPYWNMVRFGIAMYGLDPSGGLLSPPFELEPVLSLITEVVQVKKVPAGTSIGYGATYVARTEEWIATLPIGYADGWRRSMQNFEVLVDGVKCPIVGRVCMDQCMIRLPDKIKVGEKVVLVGKSNDANITLQEVADYVNTIHYEVACNLSYRVPRVYTGI